MQLALSLATQHVSAWMGNDQIARFVVGDHLTVEWSNGAAARLVGEVAGLDIRGGKLFLGSSALTESLRVFVRNSGTTMSSLCLCVSDDEHLLCAAMRLGGGSGERPTGLTLRSTAQAVPLGSAALQVAYQLTGAERRIVELLDMGRTADEVSETLRISIGTVRGHIRHIYDKLQVASREAMFHKLVPFATMTC